MVNSLASLCLAAWICIAGKSTYFYVSLISAVDDELLASQPASQPVFLGTLPNLEHDTSGKLYAIDEKTFFIQDFTYDGFGPSEC